MWPCHATFKGKSLCQRWITWPVSKRAEITTYLESSTPHCLFTIWLVGLRWRSMAVYSWASPLLSDFSWLRMRCITWPVIRGSVETTYLESPTPLCLFTIQLLGGYTMTIKGSLLLSVPIVKPFSAENFPSPTQIGPQNGGFSQKWGCKYYFFIFKTPNWHILTCDRVFWRILREDQFWGLGCSLFEEPKNEHLGVIFHAYGEKKNPGRICTKFCTGEIPRT